MSHAGQVSARSQQNGGWLPLAPEALEARLRGARVEQADVSGPAGLPHRLECTLRGGGRVAITAVAHPHAGAAGNGASAAALFSELATGPLEVTRLGDGELAGELRGATIAELRVKRDPCERGARHLLIRISTGAQVALEARSLPAGAGEALLRLQLADT